MSHKSNIWGSRRRFIKTLCAAGASNPLINATLASSGLLWSRSVFAADEDTPLRYILIHTPGACGARPETWHPTGYGSNYELGASSSNFEAFKDKMVFIDNINGSGGHSDKTSYITNKKKESIDQYLSQTIGAAAPYSWLGASISGLGRSSVSGGKNVSPDTNPFSIYRRFFGSGESSVSIDGLDLTSARYVSVLNSNRQMVQDVKLKLGPTQKHRFNEIENAIDETEQAIKQRASNQTGSCSSPAWGGAGQNEATALADGDFRADILMEVIALAMKCDMTRVATLSIDRTDIVPTVGVTVHDMAHDGSLDRPTQSRLWLNSKITRLMSLFENSHDTDGHSLLYNSLIHQVSDYGDGKSHSNNRAPFFLAGHAKGNMNPGKNFDGATFTHADILDTVGHLAGVLDEPNYPQYGNGQPINNAII